MATHHNRVVNAFGAQGAKDMFVWPIGKQSFPKTEPSPTFADFAKVLTFELAIKQFSEPKSLRWAPRWTVSTKQRFAIRRFLFKPPLLIRLITKLITGISCTESRYQNGLTLVPSPQPESLKANICPPIRSLRLRFAQRSSDGRSLKEWHYGQRKQTA